MSDTPSTRVRLADVLIAGVAVILLIVFALILLDQPRKGLDSTECANRLRILGAWLLKRASEPGGEYPPGGTSPGRWNETCDSLAQGIGDYDTAKAPCARLESPMNPMSWSSCSYAYLANLTPTYTCTCTTCRRMAPDGSAGLPVWSLYWSGVTYAGGHAAGDFHAFRDFPLGDNLRFDAGAVDPGEPLRPTVPVHQDTARFHDQDVVKRPEQRALRQVPGPGPDPAGGVPLLIDIVVLKALPAGAEDWSRAHLYVTEQNKRELMYANHC
jgi:hypothetical protein